MSQQSTIHLSSKASILVAIVFAIPSLLYTLRPAMTTYNVTATTERVRLHITETPRSRWVLEEAELALDPDHPDVTVHDDFSIQLCTPADVYVERVAKGPLWINVSCLLTKKDEGGSKAPGIVYKFDGSKHREISAGFDIYIDKPEERAAKGITTLIPVSGDVTLGRTLGQDSVGTTAILREGNVSMLSKTLFTKSIVSGGSATLQTGDRFDAIDVDEKVPTEGFISVDERPAMTIAYRVDARNAEVTRPGGGSYRVSTPNYRRWLLDRLVQLVMGSIFFVAACLQIVESGRTILDRRDGLDAGKRSLEQ